MASIIGQVIPVEIDGQPKQLRCVRADPSGLTEDGKAALYILSYVIEDVPEPPTPADKEPQDGP